MSKFQKRHYEVIADALHEADLKCLDNEDERMGVRQAYYALRDTFQSDNPHFKTDRFLARCFGPRETNDNRKDR